MNMVLGLEVLPQIRNQVLKRANGDIRRSSVALDLLPDGLRRMDQIAIVTRQCKFILRGAGNQPHLMRGFGIREKVPGSIRRVRSIGRFRGPSDSLQKRRLWHPIFAFPWFAIHRGVRLHSNYQL